MSRPTDRQFATPGNIYWCAIEPFWNRLSKFGTAEQYAASCVGVPNWIVLLHAAHWVEAEVCNGGFAQLFENSTGVLVPEGILGFQAIGMTETALLIDRASEELGSPYPRGHEQRMARLREFEPEAFDAAEDDFFELLRTEDGGFEIAADKYAQRMQAA